MHGVVLIPFLLFADPGAPPKRIFGFTIPRVEQILQHEHVRLLRVNV